MEIQITSSQNPRIKDLVRLQEKHQERNLRGLFVVEGFREIIRALRSGWQLETLYWLAEIDRIAGKKLEIMELATGAEAIEVSRNVFEKIAFRESSDGLLAVLKMKEHSISALNLPQDPLILVLESVEKPGNLGAILRTADGAGIHAVIVTDLRTDIYNPNTVRASLGCLFSMQIAISTNDETQTYLEERNIATYAAALTATHWYDEEVFLKGTAFVLGTEAEGLSDFWLKSANRQIKIPMKGIADSLNVAATAAILSYEAVRQRKTNT